MKFYDFNPIVNLTVEIKNIFRVMILGIIFLTCNYLQAKAFVPIKGKSNSYKIKSFHFTAKQITVKGRVVDEQNLPLPGVSITVKGKQNATSTNIEGVFSLNNVSEDDIIVISFLGYVTQELKASETLNVKLVPNTENLDEVIVVGYGTQKKESVVGAISQIKGEELKRVGGVTTVSEGLQGLIPGLTAINSNGKPGSDNAQLLIRGIATFNGGSSPFVLVDGVERDLNQIDPNEIENISVLKDASATAVYGTRGANGVILVTTKRGKTGRPEFSFTSNFGFKTPTVNVEYKDYVSTLKLYNEAAINDRLFDRVVPESVVSAWEQNIGNAGPNNQFFPQVDWWDELVRDVGYQKSYNLNANGGSEFMRYFVSLGYVNDGDIYNTQPNDSFDPSFKVQRYNWRSNFDFDITKSTVFSINFSGNFRYRNQPAYRIDGGGETGFGQDQFFQKIYQAPRNEFPLTYPDGFPGESSLGANNILLAINSGGQRIYKYFQGFYDAQIDQKLNFITKGLSLKGKITYTSGSNYETSITDNIAGNDSELNVIRFSRRYDLSRPIINPDGTTTYPLISEIRYPRPETQDQPLSTSGDQIYGYLRNLYYEASLNYANKFGNHDVSAIALVNRRANLSQGNTAALQIPLFGEDYVARATYGFKSRYLAEFNGSYTGSSKFANGQKFGFFPSGAVGWVISEEPYFKKLFNAKIIDYLKVRYNLGLVGSDDGIGSGLFLQSYSVGSNTRFGDVGANIYGPLYAEGATANPNATWEKATKQNFGIDFQLFSKLRGSIDLFQENRTDILMRLRQVPPSFGNIAPTANVGETKNHGYEIELNYNDKIGEKFNYFVRVNYNWSENRITFRDDARLTPDYLKDAGKQIGYLNRFIQAGYYNSIDDIYNSATSGLGVPQTQLIPGDFLYYDYNGDGVINQFDSVPQASNGIPLQNYSATLGFNYKNFGLTMQFYGTLNTFKEVDGNFLWDFNNGFINGQPNISDRWTPTNLNAAKPSLHISNLAHNQSILSTYTFVDATYLRLKSAEISYRITSQKLKQFGLRSLQIYSNGNNLLTFTKLDKRIDPETTGASVYPVVRRYNLGLRVGF